MSDQTGLDAAAVTALHRAIQRVPQVVVRHGTVTELQTGGLNIHDVAMDGDEPDVSISVHDITQNDVSEGARVTVLFAPPHQGLIIGNPIIDDWHFVGDDLEPDFNTNWDHGAGTSPPDEDTQARVSFRRIGPWVELRGSANRSSGSQTRIFTLPEGYRPRNNLIIQTSWGPLAGGTDQNMLIDHDGSVSVVFSDRVPVFLDGLMFSAT